MKNTDGESSRDSGILSSPISFLRSGNFSWYYAGLYNRGSNGYYWSLRSANTSNSYSLLFSNTYLDPQSVSNRGYGFAVRAIKNPQNMI